jgi:phosphoribosylformylglycinamidine synthase
MVGVNEDAQNVLPSKLQESGNVLYLLDDSYYEWDIAFSCVFQYYETA